MSSDSSEVPVKVSQECQKFLSEFIQVYYSYTCLWKYSCKDYRNREVKERAYKALVEKMREIDPRADRNSVMRKINALRTAFRREYKKVRRVEVLARCVGSRHKMKKYVPSLWYYDALKFVVDQQDFSEPGPGQLITEWPTEPPVSSSQTTYTSVDEDGKIVNHNEETFMEYLVETPSIEAIKIESASPASSRAGTPSTQVISTNSASTPDLELEINSVYSEKGQDSSNKRDEPAAMPCLKEQAQQTEEQSNAGPNEKVVPSAIPDVRADSVDQQIIVQRPRILQTQTEEPADVENTNHLDCFGTYVIAKLKKSSGLQCVIAEKIIAEVLMRANLGTLDEGTTLTDVKVPQNH